MQEQLYPGNHLNGYFGVTKNSLIQLCLATIVNIWMVLCNTMLTHKKLKKKNS